MYQGALRASTSGPQRPLSMCAHSQCSGLQAGGEANLAVATRSVPVTFRRSRTLLRDGEGSLTCSRLRHGFDVPSVIVMQLRYSFRLYPDAAQQASLARAFGCARVVFNDAVRAREDARTAGRPFPTAGQLSRKLITEAKRTKERSWLGEVSAVVLQQSLRDAETAYRNFFASLGGTRKGRKLGAPRFKSRKDARQSIRFTANARWSITDHGRLNLPKIGAVKVKWSRALPTTPSSVTVIKDAAGRFFASFVIDTNPDPDAARMPATESTIGIDLGLTHFAVLSDAQKLTPHAFCGVRRRS